MKFRLTLALFAVLSTSLMAQPAQQESPQFGWKKNLVVGLNLTQNRFSDNWTQGGENSFAWQGKIDTKWENDQAKTNWRNTGKVTYGQVKQGDQELRKSEDEIAVESVLTYKTGRYLNPYFAFNGQTQLTRGYNYSTVDGVTVKEPVSDFFSPAFLRQSAGVGYKPSENFLTRLGFSVKETIVSKAEIVQDGNVFAIRSRYGNEPDQAVRVETGIESTTDFSKKLQENVIFASKLEMFTSFENFGTVDVNWDNTLTAKIWKYFALNLNVRMLYDKDILDEVQAKQTFGFGITYTLL